MDNVGAVVFGLSVSGCCAFALEASSAMRFGFSGAMRTDASKLSAAVKGKVVHGGEGTMFELMGAM